MEKMAKLRREESSEMTTIQEEIRTAPGDLVKAAELQSKMNLVALETEKQISELAKASPLPIFPPPKRSFSGDCPYCSASNLVEISDRSGETRSVVCHGCQNRFNVHLTAGRTFLVRPLPKTQVTGEARPFEKGVRQFLAQTDAWIEPAHLKGLIQITLDADRRLKEAAAIRTPASLLAKALEQEHQLQASSISRVMLRRFHKLLFMGRTFRFGEGATPGFKSVYTADLDENGLLHGFIAASVARASRHTPISHQEIPALARLLLPPEITDREQMIESAIEQLPKNFFDGE